MCRSPARRSPAFRVLAVLILGNLMLSNLPGAVSAADLSGTWSGYWISDTTGHRGPLRCTLTRIGDTAYRADFSGRFFKIVPFRYSLQLAVVQNGDTVELAGVHELGRRGDFHYQAEANHSEFVASYSSCKDAGRFVLSRCTVWTASGK